MKMFLGWVTTALVCVILFMGIVGVKEDQRSLKISNAFLEGEVAAKVEQISELREDNKLYRKILLQVFGLPVEKGVVHSTTVTVTTYNPTVEQCDSDPLIAADLGKVMPGIVAMPPEYREAIGIEFGQTIVIDGLGSFLVRDHMNPRFGMEPKVDVISFIPGWSINEKRKMYWITKI